MEQPARSLIEPLEGRVLLSVSLDANGWTVITPSASAQKIYVSSSSGSDANNGLAPADDPSQKNVGPVATLARAYVLVRNNSDDELLLKRGDTFVGNFGGWGKSGISHDEPIVVSNYGDASLPRPVVDGTTSSAFSCSAYVTHLAIMGVDFTSSTHDPSNPHYEDWGSYGFYCLGTLDDLLIEDCCFQNFVNNITLQATTQYGPISNVVIRRSEILDAYNTNGNSQGLYSYGVQGLTVQDNVFDHNGWSEKVADATANIYSHDAYVASNNVNCVITGNLFAEASSHGLQARGGGVVDDNLFLSDPTSLSFGLVNGATTAVGGITGEVIGNVFLKARALAANSPGGIGAQMGNIKPGGGTEVAHNIFEDDTQGINPAMQFAPGYAVANPQSEVGLNTLVVEDNIVHNWGFGLSLSSEYQPGVAGSTDLSQVVIRNNDFQNNLTGRIISHANVYDPRFESWSGNTYASSTAPASWYRVGNSNLTFAQWQQQVEPTAISATVPYVDENRTLETYMASQGLTPTEAAWLAGARALNKSNWDPRFLPTAVVSYIQAGYVVDTHAPTATLTPPADVTPANSKTTSAVHFTVSYADDVAVDPGSIAAGNVTVTGKGGVSLPVTLIGTTGSGPFVTATYQASPPTGGWTALPDGTYVISLATGQVKDTSGNVIPGESLGSFQLTAGVDAQPPTTAPTLPINFTAKAGSSSISLSWSDSAGDQRGFIVRRALDAGFTQNVQGAAIASDATSYVDQSVNVGTTYYYQLVATNSVGNSAPTATSAATVLPPAPAIANVILNDGNPARASFFSATVVFTQPVAMDPNMVGLLTTSNGATAPSPDVLAVTNPSGDGRTWVVTWNSGQPNSELADGAYSLVVYGPKITDAYGQTAGQNVVTPLNVSNPPQVTNVVWTHMAPPHTLAFTFNEDVSASLSLSSLKLLNGSSQTVPAASYFWDPKNLTATYTFSGALPDNAYRAQISAATTTNSAGVHLDGNGDGIPGDDYVYNFYLGKPTLTLTGNANANVGAPYTLKLSNLTDTSGMPSNVLINWGDGTTTSTATLGTFNHTYTSPVGATQITIDVTDANGTHVDSAALPLLVSRASIALTGGAVGGVSPAANVNPNGTYVLNLGAVSDPGYAVSQYIIHWGDGTTSTTSDPSQPISHVFTNARTYAVRDVITVVVVDNSGPVDSSGNPTPFTNVDAGSISLTVNSWPYVWALGEVDANVGGTYRLIVAAPSDPGFAPSQVTIHWGDGTAPQTFAPGSTILTHTYTATGTDTIKLDLTDPSGTYTTAGLTSVTVNPAPTVALTGSASAHVGGTYLLNLPAANDIGQTVSGYTVHWGDGTTSAYTTPGTVSHVYSGVGSDTITVDVTDGTGTFTAAGSSPITVNSDPTVPLSGSAYANAGGIYTLTLGPANDPGQKVSGYTIHWGDGSTSTAAAAGPATHTYASAGSQMITVDVTDATGTYSGAGTLAIVASQPSLSLGGRSTVFQGTPYSLTLGPAYDLGGTPSQYVVRWGDGSSNTYTSLGVVTHTYSAPQSAIVTADLVDSTGTFRNAGSAPLTVDPPPTIALQGASTARVYAPYTLNLGAVTDPAGAVTGYTVHWGDGTKSTYTAGGNVTHTYTAAGTDAITVDLSDPTGTYANAGKPLNVAVTAPVAQVVSRQVFYNDSAFDGNNPAANSADNNAIAAGKTALLPGHTATFANYTSYSKGINGIMVDVASLAAGNSLSAADFTFRVGFGGNPSAWAAAPAPSSITVLRGAGANGSDRIEIIWRDNSIVGQWLQVTMLPTVRTGLAAPDVFYFGNAPGETGNSQTDAQVTAADVLLTRRNLSVIPVSDANPYDFNRDGVVNAADILLARSHTTTAASALQLISV